MSLTSTVGFPRLSKIWRANTLVIVGGAMVILRKWHAWRKWCTSSTQDAMRNHSLRQNIISPLKRRFPVKRDKLLGPVHTTNKQIENCGQRILSEVRNHRSCAARLHAVAFDILDREIRSGSADSQLRRPKEAAQRARIGLKFTWCWMVVMTSHDIFADISSKERLQQYDVSDNTARVVCQATLHVCYTSCVSLVVTPEFSCAQCKWRYFYVKENFVKKSTRFSTKQITRSFTELLKK